VRWHAAGTDVVVLGGGGWRTAPGVETALEQLRRAGVGAIDLLVVADGDLGPPVVDAVIDRHPAGAVLVPVGSEVTGEVVPIDGVELDVGAVRVAVIPAGERLVVDVAPPR
jgi:hypothetical protein